jgi:hypothetical protein
MRLLAGAALLSLSAVMAIAGDIQGTGIGDLYCNCGDKPTTVTLDHQAYVQVTILDDGNGHVTTTDDQPTGKTEGKEAVTAEVAPGTCLYVFYKFTCCQDEEGEWICEEYQWGSNTRAPEEGEC